MLSLVRKNEKFNLNIGQLTLLLHVTSFIQDGGNISLYQLDFVEIWC